MPTFSAEAIVIKKSNFSEADQVVTLLTKSQGKVAAVAKGIRRMGSRKGGNLDLLNHVKIYLAEGKNLDIITEVELVSAWPNIKKDLEKISISYQIVELINEFLTEKQENYQVFNLTLQTLDLLNNQDKDDLLLQAFQIKLLSHLGFQPELSKCVRCGQDLPRTGLALSAELGGVIGPEEREHDVTAYPLSVNGVKAYRFYMLNSLNDVMKLNLPPQVAREAGHGLQYYLEYLLEKELKSPQLLNDVQKLNG